MKLVARFRTKKLNRTCLVVILSLDGSITSSAFHPPYEVRRSSYGKVISGRQHFSVGDIRQFRIRAADWEDEWDPSYAADNDGNAESANNDFVVLMAPKTSTSHFFSQKSLLDPSFESDPVFEKLCNGIGISRPSKIQSLAWPVLLSGKHAIVAEQTGSGKTLAYLIPLLRKALVMSDGPKLPGAPRILVLAPTAELADQIKAVCNKLSSEIKFSSMVITASGKHQTSIRDQIRMLQRQPVDIVISTPGRVATILRAKNTDLDLSKLQSLVLDEVDVLMLDDTFGPQLRTVGEAAPAEQAQFVFVTATLPDTVVAKIQKEFPGVVQILGPGLHRVAPTVKERLVDVSVPSRSNRDAKLGFEIKAKELLTVLRQTKCPRTLIFCNTIESCRQVENLLTRKDRRSRVYNVGAYHNAMTPEARNEQLDIFARSAEGKNDVDYILVCTDRAARGVDFHAAPVDHVIIFDFPADPADYVRRVGRTARAGRSGTCTVFAYGWQLPIARSVMLGAKLDTSTAFIRPDLNDESDERPMSMRGMKGRAMQQKNKKRYEIKSSIEGSHLWNERIK
ncbi:hypothetical protein MPSEU_000564100 [Mayamaea pseudoterrestris]|nr:hypothetical protein MPSEU_000564100 [Mayamaea pseudoterrestris]